MTAKAIHSLLEIKRIRYGLTLFNILLVTSLAVLLLSPFKPTETTYDTLKEPLTQSEKGWSYVLGTDSLGRDILTRVSHAFFLDLGVGLIIVCISGAIGLMLGIIAGYVGGIIDSVIMRTMDILISIPGFILAIAIASTLGGNLWNAILAISIVSIPIYARLSRGLTLSIKENLFVTAAREAGLSNFRIMIRHVLPHVLPVFITQATLELSNAILYFAGLSFIGLGAQEPTPEWGLMMSVGRKYIREAWWFPTMPGVFMFLTVLSINLMGDGIRDYLDPKKRLRG
ncbi:MAG: ABC transporter permease [Sulfolobales archaeon]|nr:ABC transporter permease [Sulfolobales archaeon]MCX8199518.1 ABC transporter permease [Sulfolobales archaeon]MDW8170471.1 ABC transporter permease [Desulfurococcaceae archaeon]